MQTIKYLTNFLAPHFFRRFVFVALAILPVSLDLQAQEPPASEQTSPAEDTANAATQPLASSSSSSEVPLYPSRGVRDKTLIAQAAGEQAQWLDTEHGKLLAFYRPTEARTTHGVLVLFHSAEDPQTWPPILENLRANLPRFGWETLAITLPHRYPQPIPLRPSSASSSTVSTTESTEETPGADAQQQTDSSAAQSSVSSPAVPRDTLIQAYVQAAFDFLQGKGQMNAVVLVDNSSATPVIQHLLPQLQVNAEDSDRFDGPIQALVITNLQSQEPLTTNELVTLFGNPKLPVLDVFFNPDTAEQKRAKEAHRAVAMRQKLEVFQQAALDSQPKIVETDPRSFLAARVRGFMKRHADGAEADKVEGEEGRDNNAQ